MRTYEYMIIYRTKDGYGREGYSLKYRLTPSTIYEFERQIEVCMKRKVVITNIQLLRVRGA